MNGSKNTTSAISPLNNSGKLTSLLNLMALAPLELLPSNLEESLLLQAQEESRENFREESEIVQLWDMVFLLTMKGIESKTKRTEKITIVFRN